MNVVCCSRDWVKGENKVASITGTVQSHDSKIFNYLMSEATVFRGELQLEWLGEGCMLPAETCQSPVFFQAFGV